MIEPLYPALGLKIRRIRQQRGWTQEDLADAIGYTRPQVANVELGNSRIAIYRVYDIAEVLRIDPLKLMPNRREIRRLNGEGGDSDGDS